MHCSAFSSIVPSIWLYKNQTFIWFNYFQNTITAPINLKQTEPHVVCNFFLCLCSQFCFSIFFFYFCMITISNVIMILTKLSCKAWVQFSQLLDSLFDFWFVSKIMCKNIRHCVYCLVYILLISSFSPCVYMKERKKK